MTMVFDVEKHKGDLKTAAQARIAALVAAPANDPARQRRVDALTSKWYGLKSQEEAIGQSLADDPNYKADDKLLAEIDRLKTSVKADLATMGVSL
jgi:hypothetical protein